MYGTYMIEGSRIELRISSELLSKIDQAREDVPRATWIKHSLAVLLASPKELERVTGERPPIALVPETQGCSHPKSSLKPHRGNNYVCRACGQVGTMKELDY